MNLSGRLQQLTTLNAIADILNRETDFQQALAPALERLVSLLNLSTGWIFLTRVEEGDAHQGSFRLGAFTKLPPALAKKQQAPLCEDGCECQGMFSRGELDQGVNMVSCSRLKNSHGDKRGLDIHASIPLLGQHGPIGIINLASADMRQFPEDTLIFLTAVGRQLGIAYERSRLQEKRTREARYLAVLEERQRLAQDMHDSVAQLLFAADLSLSTARKSRNQQQLELAHEAVKSALLELQSLVEGLRPADLSAGLKNALLRLVQRTITLRVHLEADETELPIAYETALYRIAQEALHNSLRHAAASNVWIKLRAAQKISLSIKDDGKGLPKHQRNGLGIENMRERSQALGGTFRISSGRKGGCTVKVEIPWPTNS